jgi:hypothetical protein
MTIAIHLFSGLASSIIPGLQRGTRALESLIDKLGYADAEHHIWNEWPEVRDKIARGPRPDRVVLIGHSNGVIAITELAQSLRRMGIIVDYMGAIDPTAANFPEVPGNVEMVDEFWAASGWPAITRRFTRRKNGALHFSPAFYGTKRLYHIPGSHIACASNKDVRDTIVQHVKEALA